MIAGNVNEKVVKTDIETESVDSCLDTYETVIGLEVHIELATKTKIFCSCDTSFGGAVNSHTCPVCTGMPGALPVLNKKVVEYAIALGCATNCEINKHCRFDRKNYFYPDNPQNYQISQLYAPICVNGNLVIETEDGEKTIGIHEMHMEEDAGKLIHDEQVNVSYVDYNRSGVPLIEVVSEPDMRNAKEVIAYLEKLKMICQYLEISDCKLQEGSMRVDVNLSVRKRGSKRYGTRTEMKNLNSFRAITNAIENEAKRQIRLLENGEEVILETRRWDDIKMESYSMRSKEEAKDYRYFPEPDLVELALEDSLIDNIKEAQPEFAHEKRERYIKDFELPEYDAKLLTESKIIAEYFEEVAALCGNPKKASNWFIGEVFRLLKDEQMEPEDIKFTPKYLADIINVVSEGKINLGNAKAVFEEVFRSNVEPLEYMKKHGLMMVSDTGAIEAAVNEVLAECANVVEDYYGGKDRAFGYLVGQVMKKMRGKGDPGKVNEILREKLER